MPPQMAPEAMCMCTLGWGERSYFGGLSKRAVTCIKLNSNWS